MAPVPPRIRIRDQSGRFQSDQDWFRVRTSGPIFDGTGQRRLRSAQDEMSFTVATAAQRHVQVIGRQNFRYERSRPTRFFENNVKTDRTADGYKVNADNVIYGSWLEGTSSRNQTTRFKGYRLFRRAMQDTEARLGDILSQDELRLVRDLGGTGVRAGPTL